MEQRYRGSCLSEKNQDTAISQTTFYNFKNNWLRLQCYLHILFEKGELPTLTPDDLIYIPEDFTPSEKLKKFYQKKFNYLIKRKRNSMIQKGDFTKDISKDKNKWRIKFSKLLEHEYKELADPSRLYTTFDENELKFKKINKELTEYQKISIQLANSCFLLFSCPSDRCTDKSLSREDLKIMDRGCKRHLVKRFS
tara:strand:+ start:161 stop:745 length:585 start_codon:yes stop_codon:yes gene_type:complete